MKEDSESHVFVAVFQVPAHTPTQQNHAQTQQQLPEPLSSVEAAGALF